MWGVAQRTKHTEQLQAGAHRSVSHIAAHQPSRPGARRAPLSGAVEGVHQLPGYPEPRRDQRLLPWIPLRRIPGQGVRRQGRWQCNVRQGHEPPGHGARGQGGQVPAKRKAGSPVPHSVPASAVALVPPPAPSAPLHNGRPLTWLLAPPPPQPHSLALAAAGPGASGLRMCRSKRWFPCGCPGDMALRQGMLRPPCPGPAAKPPPCAARGDTGRHGATQGARLEAMHMYLESTNVNVTATRHCGSAAGGARPADAPSCASLCLVKSALQARAVQPGISPWHTGASAAPAASAAAARP